MRYLTARGTVRIEHVDRILRNAINRKLSASTIVETLFRCFTFLGKKNTRVFRAASLTVPTARKYK